MFTIKIDAMGKSKKNISELQKDLQVLKIADMAHILGGGTHTKKNKWNNGLGGYTPQ